LHRLSPQFAALLAVQRAPNRSLSFLRIRTPLDRLEPRITPPWAKPIRAAIAFHLDDPKLQAHLDDVSTVL